MLFEDIDLIMIVEFGLEFTIGLVQCFFEDSEQFRVDFLLLKLLTQNMHLLRVLGQIVVVLFVFLTTIRHLLQVREYVLQHLLLQLEDLGKLLLVRLRDRLLRSCLINASIVEDDATLELVVADGVALVAVGDVLVGFDYFFGS